MSVRSVVPGTTDPPRSRLRPREMSGDRSGAEQRAEARHRFREAPTGAYLVLVLLHFKNLRQCYKCPFKFNKM